jgi:YihY family inner membrane protein
VNRRTRLLGTIRAVVRGVQSDRITFIAASLAYYAFISLMPLLLLALVAASTLGGPGLAGRVVASATRTFGAEAGGLVEDALTNASGRGGATVVGFAVLVWSGLKLFRGLDVAFSTVYGTAGGETFLDTVRDGAVALVAVGVGVAATVVVGTLTARLDWFVGGIDFANVVGSAILLVGLTATFLPMYFIFPDRRISVREAVPGAALAAVGWTALQTGFRVYTVVAGGYRAYGVFGGVLLLLTFLYFGGMVLLVGAVVNATLADRLGDDGALDEAPDEAGLDAETPADTAGSVPPDRARGAVPPDQAAGAVPPEEMELSLAGTISEVAVDDEPDEDLEKQVRQLRVELAEFEDQVEDRTVHREELERELKRYVRSRARRSKARGWGPYLVLLYGTAMTLGAFYLLSDLLAVLAMLVIWLSTLGLYAVMLIVGAGLTAARLPGRARDVVSRLRD